jgi:branched-chain amino acid transport system ATP-binding protein
MNAAQSSPLLELRGVRCVLGGQPVLADVNLQVRRGERVAVIGPNGAGKTTLFQAICGLRPLRAGSVWLDGRRIDRLGPAQIARAGVGRSFQTPQVFAQLSVADNLRCALLARSRGNWLKRLAADTAIEQDAAGWLRALRLSDVADLLPRQIDDARLRALELGLALAGQAPLLLLDEPTAGMSREQAGQMVELTRQVCAGRTLLLIEHDLDTVFRLATRVVVLHQGRVLADGTPQDVRADPQVQAVYLGMGT